MIDRSLGRFAIFIEAGGNGGPWPLGYFSNTYIHEGAIYAGAQDRIDDPSVKLFRYRTWAEKAIDRLKAKTSNVGYGRIVEVSK